MYSVVDFIVKGVEAHDIQTLFTTSVGLFSDGAESSRKVSCYFPFV